MKRFLLALGLVATLPIAASAQKYLGISTSNWSGTNSIYLNPANLADNRHRFAIDLMSVNALADNDNAKFGISDVQELIRNDGQNSLKFDNSKQNISLVLPAGEVRLPGAMVSLGRNHGIAVTSRVRVMNQINNLNQDLYRTIADSLAVPNATLTSRGNRFNATANSWAEIGASYGGVIWQNQKHQIKGGVTLRYLKSLQYFSLFSKNMDLQFDQRNMEFRADSTDVTIYSNLDENGFKTNDVDVLIRNALNKNGGSGFGTDLGLVYEFRPNASRYTYSMDGRTGIPDEGKNKYLFRLSLAVTDIGSMTYKGANNKSFGFKGNGAIKGSELVDTKFNVDNVRNYAISKGFIADFEETNAKTKVYLPTTFIGGLDFNIYRGFYANLTYVQNIADRSRPGNTYYNHVTVTPRWDSKWFSAAIPITYNSLSSTTRVGLGLRASGFFIGSDDLNILFGDSYSANFYIGAFVPLNKKRLKDNDRDGVSNRMDKCRGEKGNWENRGCPTLDKDGDGILDADDACPDIAGVASADGCPDADGDHFSDDEDECPNEAGTESTNGCPDRDGDGIADAQDICPDKAGLAIYKGCPDTDNDSIPDVEDECPTQVGPLRNGGCPEVDADGDGILDGADKCPNTPGTKENNGCPEIKQDVRARLTKIGSAIQFETGKAKIKKVSYTQLDEVVKVMNTYPDYIIAIEGHTDNVGKSEANQKLSQERADEVRNFLVAKGVASSRITTNGYGDTKPIADNKTAAGRTKNRRVEMTMLLKD